MRTEQEIRERITQIDVKLSVDRISQSYMIALLGDKAILQWVLGDE